jgi:hypothetical protein
MLSASRRAGNRPVDAHSSIGGGVIRSVAIARRGNFPVWNSVKVKCCRPDVATSLASPLPQRHL